MDGRMNKYPQSNMSLQVLWSWEHKRHHIALNSIEFEQYPTEWHFAGVNARILQCTMHHENMPV